MRGAVAMTNKNITDYLHYTWIFDGEEKADEQTDNENAAEQSCGSGGGDK